MILSGLEGAKKWESIDDIPGDVCHGIIQRIKMKQREEKGD